MLQSSKLLLTEVTLKAIIRYDWTFSGWILIIHSVLEFNL